MIDHQRAVDLLRYARHFLFSENLITEDEFSSLIQHKGAVPRLEGYDEIRAKLETAQRDGAIKALEALPCLLENDIGVSDCIAATIEKYYCARCRALAEARKEAK